MGLPGSSGKGGNYRPVGHNYRKNFNRMDGTCRTCCYFLGNDTPVSEHCSKEKCSYKKKSGPPEIDRDGFSGKVFV